MALDAAAKRTNIRRSLEKYFHDNLFGVEHLDIDWEGLRFEEVDKVEWIQPRIIDFSAPYRIGRASSTQYGEQVTILFQVNIFIKKSEMLYTDRHYQLRDIILNYFKLDKRIGIYDYEGGGSTVLNYMTVRRVVDDRPLPETQELYQYVVSFDIDFTQATTDAT